MSNFLNEFHITIDLKRGIALANSAPSLVQNDSAVIYVKILDNGKPYDYSTADRYVASFRRYDGQVVNGLGSYDTATGTVKYELGSTEMFIEGNRNHVNLECAIQLYLGETRVTTKPFNLKIYKDYDGGIGSEQDLTLLQELFLELDVVRADTVTAKNNANSAADYARAIRDNFGHKGEYDNTKAYKDGNVVSYGGINYMCIKETTAGINPLNGTYWTVVSPQATINDQTWTATANQRTFTITNGKYVVGKGNIEVWVGGVPQIKDQGYGESSETTITLTEGVPAGTIVYAKWFEGHMYIAKGHQSSHAKGGQDEIDVTQLKNFKENVTDKFTTVDAQLAEKASKVELESVANGAPKGVYATLSALQTAFPTGNKNTYVVSADGNWYYWDNSAWVSGGLYQTAIVKDGVNVASKIAGGNFDDTSNWSAVSSANGTIAAANNELTYTVAGLVSTSRIQHTSFVPVVGNKYYVRGDILPKFANTTYMQLGDSASVSKTPAANAWNKISGIITATSTISPSFKFYHATNTNYVAGDTVKFKKFMVVNLTEIYGAGNEPSLADFENSLSKFTDSWVGTTQVQLAPPKYLSEALDSKVEKVAGKGLSTNDYTTEEKSAVASLAPKKVITVKKDGTGDFTSLRYALESISDANANKQYEVQIHEGVYDVFSDYTATEIESTNFIGLRIENYVHLKGIGTRGKIHLKGELADTFSSAAQARVSTIATINNGDLENLLITAKNLRYAVHDDYNYPGYKRNVKDCDFIKYAGGGYVQAYGEGCWSDTKTTFENCTFHTDTTGMPYSFHNNVNFSKPSFHRINNCKFTNKAGLTAIRFGSMGSGQKDVIELTNCKLSGQILLTEEVTNSGVGIDFDLKGYGNDVVPIEVKHTKAGQQVVYDLLGQTKELYNSHTAVITKGTLIKFNSFGSGIAPLLTTDPAIRFIGVAMKDIPVGELGFVRIEGYLPINETNLTGLVLGDKIGIVDGLLVKVTSGDYIGYVEVNNYIKLV